MECGRRQCESNAGIESGRDRVSIDDGARGEHGHCDLHGAHSVWPYGMRVDRLGVGDVSEVPAGAWSRGHSSISDDGGAADRKCDFGLVCRYDEYEQDTSREPCWNGLSINDGAWVKHGDCEIHGAWSHGPHGMRGDRLAIGDIGEVPCGTWSGRDSTCCDDCRRSGRECDAGMECRRRHGESNAGIESGRDRVSIDDGARGEHGHCNVHAKRSVWQDRMRVDRLEVGDVSEVSAGTWSRGYSSIIDDGRAPDRKCD